VAIAEFVARGYSTASLEKRSTCTAAREARGLEVGKKKKAEPQPEENASAAGFEDSLAELQQIVARLEDGSLPLEESMQQFETGIGLLRQCYQVLEAAESRIEILTGADRQGNPRTKPFDSSATFQAASSSSKTDPVESAGPAIRESGRAEDSLF
jgi:exodeoxyribonuclease VII small subunit